MALNIVAHRRSNTQRCLYRMTTYSQCLVHIINTFQNGHILFWAHSKNSTFQKGHIPFWAHSKKVTFCLEHIPNGTNFVLSAFQKGHTPIWAHSKLCTVYFDHIFFQKILSLLFCFSFTQLQLLIWEVKLLRKKRELLD